MTAEVAAWLRRLRPRVAAATYRQRSWMLRRFFLHLERTGKDWFCVTRSDLESYLLSIGRSSEPRRSAWLAIRDFYAFAGVAENPAKGIRFGPRVRRLINVPAQEVLERKIASVSGPTPETALRNRLLIELAYGSGLRRRELALLNVEDLDLGTRSAWVRGKGDKARIVPLTARSVEAARRYLAHRKAGRGPLLVSCSSLKHPRLSPNWIGTLCKAQTGLNTHLLRHACATHLMQAGCGVRLVQELLGHRFLTTTQRYTHISREWLSDIVNACHPRARTIKGQRNGHECSDNSPVCG